MEISSPPSPPLLKSRIRVLSFNFLRDLALHPIHQFPLFFFFFVFFSVLHISTASSSIPYAKYCNAIVPDSSPTDTKVSIFNEFQWLREAYFEGGEQIFNNAPKSGNDSYWGSLHFQPRKLYRTLTNGVIKVQGELSLHNRKSLASSWVSVRGRGLRNLNGPLGFPVRSDTAVFLLEGFWSSASGKLCMVGPGSISFKSGKVRSFHVVLKLNYSNSSSITSAFVSGTLDSLDVVGSFKHFDPVSILGVPLANHDYTLIEKENENGGFSAYDGYENVSLSMGKLSTVCSLRFRPSYFALEYEEDCSTVNCNPLGGSSDNLPSFMSFDKIWCLDKQRVQTMLRFSNSSYNGYGLPFDPNVTLVAQGIWDEKKNRVCLIACHFVNYTDSLANAFLGDCSIKLCFRFPAMLSIRNSSMAVGQIWSNKTVDKMGFFCKIMFRSCGRRMLHLPGLKYEYTKIDEARRSCAIKKTGRHKGTYPDGYSRDMSFDMSVRDVKGRRALGHISPLTVGDKFYEHFSIGPVLRPAKPVIPKNMSYRSLLNISYKISFTTSPGFKVGGENYSTKYLDIFAEGTYDTKTGLLCMIGCIKLLAYNKRTKNESVDCEIHVRIQYPPLNAKGRTSVTGTIQSTRRKSDPLYFGSLELTSNSIYMNQAAETMWRMDLVTIMVLISKTLACVFVGFQLFHVRRHPDVLPFISIMMLMVLTLAHLIPLVLNFEALFLADRNRQNVFLGSGGWLEVNEVIVRVVTMIAFLLHFRLLQLTWTSREADGNQKGLYISDKKVLYLSLPLYVGGGMIAWFAQRWRSSHLSPFLRRHISYKQNFLWDALRSYAGLVLDGFLLPQIMFNLFSDSRDKALAPSFYVGTTVVRLLPHAYDLYRIHSSPWSFGLSFMYANPRMELYTTAWDITIPCCGLLFAGLIYLQQRFGGHSILPKRFKESTMYEIVPVAGGG